MSQTSKQITVTQLKRIIKERYSRGDISREEKADRFSEGVREGFIEERRFQ